MSEIKVNTITKRTGSTLTIGESGEQLLHFHWCKSIRF